MSTITKPMALNETFKTTETTPRNQADVLAGIQQAIREGFGQVASGVEFDNTDSGLDATNVQDAIVEVKGDVDDVAEDVESIEDNIASTKEVTGNPITLTDAAPINAEKLEVVLEPKQDLHGQSYPYVGGAGKNKFNANAYFIGKIEHGVTITMNDDGSFVVDGTTTSQSQVSYTIPNDVAKTFAGMIFSGGHDSKAYFMMEDYGSPWTQYMYDENGDAVISNDIASATQRINLLFRARANTTYNNEVFKPMIRLSTVTDATFAPYTNICPISGYDSVSVDDVGFNLISQVYDDKYINHTNGAMQGATGFHCTDYIHLYANETYYFKDANMSGDQWGAIYTLSDKTFISAFDLSANTEFTAPAYDCYFRITIANAESCINVSDANKNGTFEPYQSTTTSITFGQTVYGGKSDFVKGGTENKLGFKTFDGTENWDDSNANGFKITVSDSGMTDAKDHARCISNLYKYGSSVWTAGCFGIASVTRTLWVENATSQRFANLAAFKAYLSEHPLQVCYELDTPTIITTPIAPLKLLENINNISTNGTTINLGYQQNNVVGELKGEIEQAANNFTYALLMSDETSCSLAYTDDYTSVDVEIPLVQTYTDTQTQQNYTVDYTNCEFAINGVDIICSDYQHDWVLGAEWKVIPQIGSALKQDGKLKVSLYLRNWKLTSSDNTIRYVTLMLDTLAFGKYVDSRT